MARQVAHDIKNPLTPIQLSAEHARRVNIDRGRPLSPVLDECVSVDPLAGQAAPADLGRVLELRLVADRAARSRRRSPAASRKSSSRTGRGSPAALRIDVDAAPTACRRVQIDRTLFARALTNVIENALHAMPGGGRSDAFAPRRRPPVHRRIDLDADTGVGMDAGGARADLRALLLDQGDRAPASA